MRRHKKKKKSTTINNLNDDVLIIIFKYLSFSQRLLMERVCVRWSIIAQQSWGGVTTMKIDNNQIYGMSKDFHSEELKTVFNTLLMRCGRHLNTLTITNSIIDSSILPIIRFNCCHLTQVDLIFKTNAIEHFVKPFGKMKKLKSCKITNVKSLFARDCLISLPNGIETIHMEVPNSLITFSSRLLLSSLSSVFIKFNSLRSLTLRGYRFSGLLINAISQCQTLTFVDLQNSVIEKIDDLSNLTNLKYLNVSKVERITNSFLILVADKCKKLEYLDVSYCKRVNDDGVKEIIKHCLNLEQLKIAWTSVTSGVIISAVNLTKYRRGCPILHLYPGKRNTY
ncbi:hypothetical protein HCN44_008930 [Aphidius gifuensis]|uniref:F-box domain-containing protein n=1 Tax=Aphidius gifuensis TaxID=684658 RepID=A0A835CP73_APHGI|nr:hypothetical protein HCN44_008930 [Aphidius gifuensis]